MSSHRPCPRCGGTLEQDMINNGGGMEPCGPLNCPACYWFDGDDPTTPAVRSVRSRDIAAYMPKFSEADIRYQEQLRKYQVDVAEYESAAKSYKAQLQSLSEGEPKPLRPIPPILPVKPVKFSFTEDHETSFMSFNSGVEAAALHLESIGENTLAELVRSQKR